jgi:hypothetical protein
MAVARPIPIPTITRPTEVAQPASPLAQAQADTTTSTRFRRCTFRRVSVSAMSRSLPVYEVDCMFPDRITPLPLGDLAAAHPVCAACTNPGIFRADSD